MLQNFKCFIVFYGLLTICLTLDQWFFGFISFLGCHSHLSVSPDLFLHLSFGQRLLGLGVQSIGTALFVGTLYLLYGIIQNLQVDQTFTQDTIYKMGKMIKFYLGYTIFHLFYEVAYSLIISMNNPPGQRYFSISFGTDNLNQIFIACCLYIVFHVMKEAYRVSSEYKMVI